MKRVTKQEVKKAMEKSPYTRDYCVCGNCHYAFKVTEEERKRYASLVCGNCKSRRFHYAYSTNTNAIIDPEHNQEQYYCYVEDKQPPTHIHNSLDDANKEADRLAALELGKKVLVLKVINTRVATSKIEYERS